uniref:LisH domain-containing protein n=1 Tax=Syphacia muris TaxID=451379 RepID=A0A0N5AV19_9BILA
MVDVVNAHLQRVLDYVQEFKGQWDPVVSRCVEQFRRLYVELIETADEDAELSVTAQVLLEEAISRINALLTEMALKHRTGHTLISKTGKEIERNFVSDLTCLTKNEKNFDSDPKLHKRVNALITEHLTSTGKFEVAETLLKEAPLPTGSRFPSLDNVQARQLIDAFSRKDVAPALEWLTANAPQEEGLIFDLQKQQFIKYLQEGEKIKALEYTRQLANRADEVGSLMWAMVVKDPEKRYPQLFNQSVWHQLELRLARVLSQSDNYLNQILETGIKAVPSLITLRAMMANRRPESLFHGDELPIEVEVPCHIHSVFSCPILKAQCTEANPPMRLNCGHVISRDALQKLVQNGRFANPAHISASYNHSRLKCPYCPIESNVADAKRVYF